MVFSFPFLLFAETGMGGYQAIDDSKFGFVSKSLKLTTVRHTSANTKYNTNCSSCDFQFSCDFSYANSTVTMN